MQRLVGKLVLNGNSTQVTIQRPILRELGWLPSECVVLNVVDGRKLLIERLEDAIAESNARIGALVNAPAPVKA